MPVFETARLIWSAIAYNHQPGAQLTNSRGDVAQLRDLFPTEDSPIVTDEDHDRCLVSPRVAQTDAVTFRVQNFDIGKSRRDQAHG